MNYFGADSFFQQSILGLVTTLTNNFDRCRVAIVVEVGKPIKVYASGDDVTNATEHFCFPTLPPHSLTIDTDIEGWTTHRVALHAGALEGEKLYEALRMGDASAVHILGDSFVVQEFPDVLHDLLAENGLGDVMTSFDGIGGLAFYETDGRGELVIKTSIMSVLEKLKYNGAPKQNILLESNPLKRVGDSRNVEWSDAMGWVRDVIGTRFVYTLEAMFCGNDGSAGDLAQIATGLWPSSLTGDGTHPTEAGREIYAKAAYGALVDFGWLEGTITVPTVVQTLATAGTTITWAAPANDGGSPILGYKIERNTGSWVAQTPQGSAAGYTKQYIRSWVAPASGTYRVSAITRKGTGSPTTIVV
ncbi:MULTISPECIES: fibronectin type III domain-containing protein [Falsihalocynthiibacter]|uniref:fibronectin type III domain-containing protein n=1 Tax=Falsihalocynthiibacter TaxID=2854182 RepID=UPI0030013C61